MDCFSVFIISFTIALSGAMAPGPLLAAVISGSLKTGFKTGHLIIAGHALLEIFMVVVLGFGRFINTPVIIRAISIVATVLLIYFGWFPDVRKKNLHLIINNTRFLIFNWVKVKYLASYLLALSRRIVSQDWQSLYNHPIYFMETFVDTEKFAATCYKADNWIYLGETTRRGKLSKSNKPVLSRKAVYGYPTRADFRKSLNAKEE